MAVAKTGAIFKTFTFDGESSRDYGVYLTGEGVYNAPEREVEMVSIPNRNGAFALDKGRFENIEVTYPAGIFADNEADFVQGISDLRNLLCSKRGYVRLEDDYNPDEYRMAIYKSGLEVEPALLRAGEFEITFECMPQRFLKSGETKVTMASGGTLTNPTLFDAKPMIELYGYGTADVNGYPINIKNMALGEIVLNGSIDSSMARYVFDGSVLNSGDHITILNITGAINQSFLGRVIGIGQITKSIALSGNADYDTFDVISKGSTSANTMVYNTINVSPIYFTYGAAGYLLANFSFDVHMPGGYTVTASYKYKIEYDGATTITFYKTVDNVTSLCEENSVNQATAVSTVSALGNPTYIDCDLGVSYKIMYGQYISLDHLIDLGTALPVLNPGSNTVTFDNTFSQVDIIPRWWKV